MGGEWKRGRKKKMLLLGTFVVENGDGRQLERKSGENNVRVRRLKGSGRVKGAKRMKGAARRAGVGNIEGPDPNNVIITLLRWFISLKFKYHVCWISITISLVFLVWFLVKFFNHCRR